MNYHMYKAKKKVITFVINIPFIKRWYIGNEYLKNPPTVTTSEHGVVDSMHFVNVTLIPKSYTTVTNNTFESTLTLGRYFK